MRTPDELQAISSLLDEALDLAVDERTAWLCRLEGEAASLRPTLQKLLASLAGGETGDLLGKGPLFTAPAATHADTPAFVSGQEVGAYRLLREIGRGGMGEVWLAERSDGYLKRALALKLPTLGIRRSVLIQRFARERDILAALTHPHIARLYDAGMADDGQPFLALEYIDGLPITAFCTAGALDLRARVELMRQVMDAVQHAHANLVIHRDLKPSNVLVTADGKAMLLDFGIAKLLEEAQAEASETELTRVGGRALTLGYAAPEQLEGASISIAVDVWALGVLLYEVLTDRRPFSGTPREVEHAILGDDPPLPKGLPKDLVTIIGKALRKAPRERYATVASLGEDLDRWLKNEPVLARADRLSYRMQKFVLRHKAALAVSIGVLATVLAASIVSVWQARAATVQARRAEAVQAQLVRLFAESDPEQARGRSFSAKELLDRRAASLRSDLRDQPEVLADLEKEIGRAYRALQDNAAAVAHLQASVEGYDRLGAAASERAIEARLLLAEALNMESRLPEASEQADRTLSLATRHLGAGHPLALRAMLIRGGIEGRLGRSSAAAALYQSVIELLDKTESPASLLRLTALRGLARQQLDLVQLDNASRTAERIETEMSRLDNVNVSTRLGVELDTTILWFDMGRYPEALDRLPSLVGRLEAHLGASSPAVHAAQAYWAVTLAAVGRYDEAIEVGRKNLSNVATRVTADNEEMSFHRLAVSLVLYEAGRFEDALVQARESLAFLAASPHSVAEISMSRAMFGLLLQATGQTGGVSEARAGVAGYAAIPGRQDHASLADLLHWLAATEHSAGNDAAALEAAERAVDIWRRRGNDSPPVPRSRSNAMAAWLRALANPLDQRAVDDWHAAAQAYAALRAGLHLSHADLSLMDAELLTRTGKPREAEKAKSVGAQHWHRSTGRSAPGFLTLH